MHEVQAIEYFTSGCREGTLLKHKLLCDEPETLDELLIIADKYATADSSMKAEIQVSATSKVAPQAPRTPAGDASRRNSRTTTSTRPGNWLPAAGRTRQLKTSSRMGSLHPSDRKVASLLVADFLIRADCGWSLLVP